MKCSAWKQEIIKTSRFYLFWLISHPCYGDLIICTITIVWASVVYKILQVLLPVCWAPRIWLAITLSQCQITYIRQWFSSKCQIRNSWFHSIFSTISLETSFLMLVMWAMWLSNIVCLYGVCLIYLGMCLRKWREIWGLARKNKNASPTPNLNKKELCPTWKHLCRQCSLPRHVMLRN